MAVKKTKLQREYAKERKKYLARVRYYNKLGYNVEPLPMLKKPTRKSIEKLKAQTGGFLKQASDIIDLQTGEIVKSKKAEEKEEVRKANKAFLAKQKQQEKEQFPVANDVDILEERWYSIVENCHPRLRELIRERGEQLMRQDKEAFLFGLKRYPDIYPDPLDSREDIIFSKFKEIMHLMNWLPDSSEFQAFVELATDNIEKEV